MSPKNSLQLKKPPPEHLLCLVFQLSQPKPRSFQDLCVPMDFSLALGDVTWPRTPGIFPVRAGQVGTSTTSWSSHPQGDCDAFLLPRTRNFLRNSLFVWRDPPKNSSFVGIVMGSRNLCSPSFLLSSGSCSRTRSDGPSGMVTWNCRKAFSCSSSSASEGAVGRKRMGMGLERGQGHPAPRGSGDKGTRKPHPHSGGPGSIFLSSNHSQQGIMDGHRDDPRDLKLRAKFVLNTAFFPLSCFPLFQCGKQDLE